MNVSHTNCKVWFWNTEIDWINFSTISYFICVKNPESLSFLFFYRKLRSVVKVVSQCAFISLVSPAWPLAGVWRRSVVLSHFPFPPLLCSECMEYNLLLCVSLGEFKAGCRSKHAGSMLSLQSTMRCPCRGQVKVCRLWRLTSHLSSSICGQCHALLNGQEKSSPTISVVQTNCCTLSSRA